MTGRELILYILQNHLEDEPIVREGKIIGFLTVSDMAKKFNVGTATIAAWISMDVIDAVKIGDSLYIPDIYERSTNNG